MSAFGSGSGFDFSKRIRIISALFLCQFSIVCADHACCQGYSMQRPMSSQSSTFYLRAVEAFQNHDYNSALALCNAAIEGSHGNKDIVHLRALSYAELGDNYNAEMQFRAALTLDYNFVPCRNNYGLFLKKTGKINEAQKNFEECIRLDPRYADAYYNLGKVVQEKGDIDKAIECYQTATELKPTFVDAQRDLGLAIYEKIASGQAGDIDESIEKLQIAAKLAPDNPSVYYDLARILCAESKLDDAEAAFRDACVKEPKYAAAHFELGKLRYYRGDPYRCLMELELAQRVSPTYTESKSYAAIDPLLVNTYKARCLEVLGDNQASADAWRKVASLEANNADTLKRIKRLEKQSLARRKSNENIDPEEINALIIKGLKQEIDGDLDSAKHSFQRALELDPKSFGATQSLGGLLEAEGDLSGAMSKYQAALALVPDYDGLYYNMAYLLEKMSLPADAASMYEKFHDMAGKYPYDPRHVVSLVQEKGRIGASTTAPVKTKHKQRKTSS